MVRSRGSRPRISFPPVSVRFGWLEETLQLAHQMWSTPVDEVRPFNGQYFQLAEPICSPPPVSQPHPPIMIGGMGEKKTLRLVAQYADACNLYARAGASLLQHKLDVLRGHCEDVGRPFEDIELTALGTIHLADGQMTWSTT
ncbi:MAG: LLM class flavin-dependent oxidoreductase [Chloroflexota bacterium]